MKKYLVLLFIFSMTLRGVFLLFVYDHPERLFEPDSYGYIRLAEALLDSFEFPSLFRTPGYPAFIASIYALTGKTPLAVAVVQNVLDSITTLIIVFICMRITGSRRFSLAAGFLYAVNPFAVYYSQMILTETVFTIIFTVATYFFLSFIKTNSRRELVLTAVLMGISVFIRPVAQYLPLLLSIFIFLTGLSFKQKIMNTILFLSIFYIIIVPWYARNYYQYQYWTLSTIKDITVFYYEAPAALMARENPKVFIQHYINEPLEIKGKYLFEKISQRYGWNEEARKKVNKDINMLKILRAEGEAIIKDNIPQVLFVHTVGIARTLFPYYPALYRIAANDNAFLKIVPAIIDCMVIAFAGLGFLSFVLNLKNNRSNSLTLYCLILLIFYYSFLPGIVAYARYRVPVIPYISIFASLGIMWISRWHLKKT